MSVRAIVRRPRRKAHLAHLAPDQRTWITYCDRLVAAGPECDVREYEAIGGVTARLQSQLRGIVREVGAQHLCADCRRFVRLIELLQQDRSHGAAFEYGLTA